MSADYNRSFKRIGGVALASILMASCSQDRSYSDHFAFTDNEKNPYAAGKARMAAGHYGLAVSSFRKALAKERTSVKTLNALAATYDLLGRFDLAERYYRQALNLDPKSVQSLNNLGYSYYLRGDYKRARGLFERAARVDGSHSVVVANLASLEKAELDSQVAMAAKRGSKVTGVKGERAPSRTPWIERSDRRVQTLVTKPDPAMVKAAHANDVEPRVAHATKPLIEITTAAPVKMDAVKPASKPAPVVAAADAKPSILTVEPKAPKASRITRVTNTEPVEVAAIARMVKPPTRSAAIQTESQPAIGSSAKTRPVDPGDSDRGIADLPKLNKDVARDVRVAATTAATAATVESTILVRAPKDPSPAITKVSHKIDRAMEIAALTVELEAVVPAKIEPPVLALMEPAPAAAKTTAEVDRPVEPLALTAKVEPLALMAKVEPVALTAKVEPLALMAKVEPVSTKSGKGMSQGKSIPKVAAVQMAALKKAVRLEISNGAGRLRMAARMGRYLASYGLAKPRLTNAKSFTNKVSVLYFKPGQKANAKSLSGALPVPPDMRRNATLGTDLRLVLGGDLLRFDRGLISKFK